MQRLSVPDLFEPLLGHFFAVVATVVALIVLARSIDRRHVSEYGFHVSLEWVVDAIAGAVLGVVLVGVAFGLTYRQGAVDVLDTMSAGTARSFAFGIGVSIVGWLFVGFWEETLFRGLFLRNAAEGLASRKLSATTALFGAWLSSSLVYGVLHGPFGTNPDGDALGYALVMTTVMGGLFGIAYLLSGELAFPIGLHAGINFAERNLFFGRPEADIPAVLRVEQVGIGSHVQFQSIDPAVIVPVFLFGYVVVTGWFSLRQGGFSPKRRIAHYR
ncbi:CPBP family intramembrane glutamic endopeptidase [Halopiger djelfimassiliensis]|uniref:CPBP family intramembrane glutamic endopeptidase n=1 Tax=Halopiger djelfimassiliensis TaxID=1293047 RepID=UPI0018A8585C|nr:CPBP family intramembrane glutamic endopeptidase [Halopiger djelfimassiliensis]